MHCMYVPRSPLLVHAVKLRQLNSSKGMDIHLNLSGESLFSSYRIQRTKHTFSYKNIHSYFDMWLPYHLLVQLQSNGTISLSFFMN